MRFFLFTIASFFTLTAFGQSPIDSGFTNKAEAKNQYKDSLKDGKWIEYRSDTIKEHNWVLKSYTLVIYKQGKRNSIARKYSMNGVLDEKSYYTNGLLNGTKIEYRSDGKVYSEEEYTEGKKNGLSKIYFRNGNVEWETPYINNKKNGVEKHYYESGKLWMETTFHNGVMGEVKRYDENGNEIKK